MTKEEVEKGLAKLAELGQKQAKLEADQKAAVITASGRFAPDLAAIETEIESLKEEIEDWAKVELRDLPKRKLKFASGTVTLTINPPKVVYDKKREAQICEELAVSAPELLCQTTRISNSAVLAAARSEIKGKVLLAELAGVRVVQEDSVRIKV